MANSSVPKHDFAPAWLKIPGETQSSFHSEYHRERLSRRDDHSSTKGPSVGRQRQSSCDQQYLRRPDVTRKPVSHRHHSIDVDESQYYNCGLGDYSIASHRSFGSQPSLNRRPLSRQENPPLLGCPAAYRGYSLYDFSNDGSRSNGFQNWNQSRHRNFERSSTAQNNNDKESTGKVLKECATDRFNIEFPSLMGDMSDGSPSSTVATLNGSVWGTDSLRNTKIYLDASNKKIQNPESGGGKSDSEGRSSSPGSVLSGSSGSCGSPKATPSAVSKGGVQNQLGSSTYRVLVPSKNILVKKSSSKDLKSTPTVITSNKNSRQSSPTPQLEILNTRLVTHPKNLGNKKSDFLKTLRNENHNVGSEECQNGFKKDEEHAEQKIEEHQKDVENQQQNQQQNGRAIEVKLKAGDGTDNGGEKPILSSSLEAEQRLLKEMGWKEEGSGDEDVYAPLTEDEMREFQNLSKKVSLRRTTMREQNCLQRQSLTWSPKKRLPFTTAASIVELEDDSCSTTSSSDSE